jgi:hypothetical protein
MTTMVFTWGYTLSGYDGKSVEDLNREELESRVKQVSRLKFLLEDEYEWLPTRLGARPASLAEAESRKQQREEKEKEDEEQKKAKADKEAEKEAETTTIEEVD